MPLPQETVRNLSAVGNRVIVLADKEQTFVWDDDVARWRFWRHWPGRHDGEQRSPPPQPHPTAHWRWYASAALS